MKRNIIIAYFVVLAVLIVLLNATLWVYNHNGGNADFTMLYILDILVLPYLGYSAYLAISFKEDT
jgi:hypothetical protein